MNGLKEITRTNLELQAQHLLNRFQYEASRSDAFTMDSAGNIIHPTQGFAVAYKEAPLTEKGLVGALQLNPELNLGFWTDEGIQYTDLVSIIQDRETAIKKGLMNNQLSIYDFSTKELIWL